MTKVKLKSILNSSNTPIFFIFSFTFLAITKIENVKLSYSAGWPDPFYYLGYAVDMESLQIRNGTTYTASRIPAILLIKLRLLLGLPNQYFRIFLIAFCATILWLYLTKIYSAGKKKSLLISVLLLNNLLFLRHISDDYALNFSMILLFPIFYLLQKILNSETRNRESSIIFGFLINLSLLCNFSTIIIIVPCLLAASIQLIVFEKIQLKHLTKIALFSLLGFNIALILNIFASILLAGSNSIQNFPTMLKAAIFIQSTQNEVWTQPLTSVIAYICLFLAIFANAIAMGILRLRKISNFQTRELWPNARNHTNRVIKQNHEVFHYSQFLIPIIFGLTWHEILGGAWLSYSFYAALYLPLVLFFFAGLIREASILTLSICLLMQFFFFFELNNSSFHILDWTTKQIGIFTLILFVFLLIHQIFFRIKVDVLATLLVLLLTVAPLNQTWSGYFLLLNTKQPLTGEYIDFANSWKNDYQENVQSIALNFAEYVKQAVSKKDSLWIVYPSETSWLTSIASTQQYGYSCFYCTELPSKIKNNLDLTRLEQYADELALRSYTIVMSSKPLDNAPKNIFRQNDLLEFIEYRMFKEETVILHIYLYKTQRK